MPVYDCRKDDPEPGSIRFPCRVRILCAVTGERIADVFYAATEPARIGRFLRDASGQPLVVATGRRIKGTLEHAKSVQWVDSKMPSKLLVPESVPEYRRLERWEDRPWVAVRLDTGEVIEKSAGAM